MKTVHKYVSNPQTLIRFLLPKNSRLLSTKSNGGAICFWFEVETMFKEEEREFRVFGTGRDISCGLNNRKYEYVNTIIMGAFVWHIYEVIRGK